MNIKFEQQKRFEGLRGLSFDLVVNIGSKKIICIEADGDQHKNEKSHFYRFHENPNKAFKHQQSRDRKKNYFCKKQGYTLIRIPYTENIDKLKENILHKFRKVT